jgi:hypothetical protein
MGIVIQNKHRKGKKNPFTAASETPKQKASPASSIVSTVNVNSTTTPPATAESPAYYAQQAAIVVSRHDPRGSMAQKKRKFCNATPVQQECD